MGDDGIELHEEEEWLAGVAAGAEHSDIAAGMIRHAAGCYGL